MLILKVISRLLDYPSEALFSASDELINVVRQETSISEVNKDSLIRFIQTLSAKNIFDAQERYDLLFDRGRSLSLLLFEHVHGESRDRGQAMVDLMNVYKSKGFVVDSSQLPDYIPLYLEFLSEQDNDFAEEWLGDISHLMTMLSERLIDRKCDYSVLFDSLIELSRIEVNREEIAAAVSQEERDDTIEAIDKEWEDKEIKFDDPIQAGEQCPSASSGIQKSANSFDPNTPYLDKNNPQVPINWHDKDAAQVSGL